MSLKMYFGHRQAREWFARVSTLVQDHPGVRSEAVTFFVVPTFVQLLPAVETFAGTHVRIGAQDVAAADAGAYTGEVSAAELAEIGVTLAEVGHAERRRLFHETDDVVAEKTAAALRNGLTPVLCVGEVERQDAHTAAAAAVDQLHRDLAGAPAGPVVVAYEPVWAIGAAKAAPVSHVATVTGVLRATLAAVPERAGSGVIYGGSAGPGLLTALGGSVDGLFLGRSAHDPHALATVLNEAAALAEARDAA